MARRGLPKVHELAFIDDIICDALIEDGHEWESEISEYPMSSGDGDKSDGIRNKNGVVTMHVIVSNTPIGPIADLRAEQEGMDPSDATYLRLLEIRKARKPITIRTSLDVFENMALKRLSAPRTSQTGDALEFTATFQQIEVTKNTRGPRVAIPGAKGGGSRKKPPVPVKQDFTDTLPTVRVYRKDGDWLWLDTNLGGWRYDALHDAPINQNELPTSNEVFVAPGTSPYRREQEGWVVYRNRPYGVTPDEWYDGIKAGKTDAEYREEIGKAADQAALGGFALNKYDPFIDFGTGDQNANSQDIRVVHAIKR